MGGNDAGIVLDDVDPRRRRPRSFQSAFQNSGQVCIAMKRLYVHESIYDSCATSLFALPNAAVVGDGLQQGTQLGPLQNKMQFEKVKDLIADAAKHNSVMGGGDVPERGYFIRPTIVRDIADGTRLVDEEQFGPVLPVIKYSDPEDALARANASPYGLGGSNLVHGSGARPLIRRENGCGNRLDQQTPRPCSKHPVRRRKTIRIGHRAWR